MFISLLAAIERSSGKCVILASAGSAAVGGDASKVADKYKAFLGGDDAGAKLRAKYSSLLYMQDNIVRNRHEFPDVAAVEKQQKVTADKVAAIEALKGAQEAHADLVARANEAEKAFQIARNNAAALGIKSATPVLPDHPAVAEAAVLREQLAQAEAAKASAEAAVAAAAAEKAAAEAAAKEAADKAAAEEAAKKAAEESATK